MASVPPATTSPLDSPTTAAAIPRPLRARATAPGTPAAAGIFAKKFPQRTARGLRLPDRPLHSQDRPVLEARGIVQDAIDQEQRAGACAALHELPPVDQPARQP